MRRAVNDTWTTLLHGATALAIVLSMAACKDKVPPDPRSPPKPKMERSTARLPIIGADAPSCRAPHPSTMTTPAGTMERCDAA